MRTPKAKFDTETALIAEFLERLNRGVYAEGKNWTVYPETAGWDLLLVHKDGFQLGLEAKLTLNAKVVAQALKGVGSYWHDDGPDYRGILVPHGGAQNHMEPICKAVGLGVIKVRADGHQHFALPTEKAWGDERWPHWLPARRCALPDYIPDVEAGRPAPIQLTDWKIKAIRLMIVLEQRGFVTRKDMKAIGISPTRWTDHYHGFLARSEDGYVRCSRTPDLKAQHPSVYAKIEAEIPQWTAAMGISLDREKQGVLI